MQRLTTMRLSLGVAAIAACAVACSATPAPDDKGSLPADAITFEASAETRQELGVTHWALEHQGTGDFNGYDDDLNVRVTFQRFEQVRDGATLYAFMVKDDEGAGRVVFSRDANSSDFTILESTIEDRYQHIGELLSNDFKTMPQAGASTTLTTQSLSSSASSLKPLSPQDCRGECLVTEDCWNLVNLCNDIIARYNAAQPDFYAYCPISRNEGKLVQTCTSDIAKDPKRFENRQRPECNTQMAACRCDYTTTCDKANDELLQTGKSAKACPNDQKLKDCRKHLNLDPLPQVTGPAGP